MVGADKDHRLHIGSHDGVCALILEKGTEVIAPRLWFA